jgi:flavin-dependent dehydrogenase
VNNVGNVLWGLSVESTIQLFLFVGRNIAPGFFAWVIPTNYEGTEARIGLCINSKSTEFSKNIIFRIYLKTNNSFVLSKKY